MKNRYEYVQRIDSSYVGEDCVQVMIPHLENAITILNLDEMIYHFKPNSNLFVNKYLTDDRRKQFPYNEIPTHQERVKGKKIEYVNQLLDFEKVYIEIADGIIKQYYAVRDGESALLVTNFLLPELEEDLILNRVELEELLNKTNDNVYSLDGSKWLEPNLASEKEILEYYKEYIMNARNKEIRCLNSNVSKEINNMVKDNVEKMTINDIPNNMDLNFDRVLIFNEDGQIKMKYINVFFLESNKYSVEMFDFPITIYSMEHIKQLEKTNLKKTPKPKFSVLLNPSIIKNELEKDKIKIYRYWVY